MVNLGIAFPSGDLSALRVDLGWTRPIQGRWGKRSSPGVAGQPQAVIRSPVGEMEEKAALPDGRRI